jgi:hypothetical protein
MKRKKQIRRLLITVKRQKPSRREEVKVDGKEMVLALVIWKLKNV